MTITTTRAFFSGAAIPGQCRIQICLGQYGVKSIFIRGTDFNRRDLRGKLRVDRGRKIHKSLAEGGPDLQCFLLDDLQNEQVVYIPDDSYRNPLSEAKHQRDLLKYYLNHLGTLAR